MRKLCLTAAFLLIGAVPIETQAQTFPVDNATLRRIWAVGMDSSHTVPLAQALLDSVGPRLTGTPGHNAGNEWIARMYRSWGIDANIERYGTWRGWRRGTSHIDLMTPRVRSPEGSMLGWSAGTGGLAGTAEAVRLPQVRAS